MARDMQKVLLGDALSAVQRNRLESWLAAGKTGTDLLRAGIPSTWRAGDKSGTGGRNNAKGDSDTRNDIAILRPPNRAPIIVTAYLTGCKLAGRERDATLAQVGRIIASAQM
jgi:beta-lactamase class A